LPPDARQEHTSLGASRPACSLYHPGDVQRIPQTAGSAAALVSALQCECGDPFPENLKLAAEADQALLDFIRTDLEMCLTMATIVESEFKICNREHAERTLAETEKGYSVMLRFYRGATGMTPNVEKEPNRS